MDKIFVRKKRIHGPELVYEYITGVRRNVDGPWKSWENQHPKTMHRRAMAYTRGADKSLARLTSRCIFLMVRIFRLILVLLYI